MAFLPWGMFISVTPPYTPDSDTTLRILAKVLFIILLAYESREKSKC